VPIGITFALIGLRVFYRKRVGLRFAKPTYGADHAVKLPIETQIKSKAGDVVAVDRPRCWIARDCLRELAGVDDFGLEGGEVDGEQRIGVSRLSFRLGLCRITLR
jgi:hypothetical protein